MRPWAALTAATIDGLPGQLGVYEVAADDDVVTSIGYAGGHEPFGLRSALGRERAAGATRFRYEITHGYLSRWDELLMLHLSLHGSLPPANAGEADRLGRLSP